MAELVELAEGVAELVRDGDAVALEGFTHLIPFAAGHEVMRQGRRDLELVRMTPDVLYDQMIGAGCARQLVFSSGGNPGVGSLHRFRDAVENDWPRPIEIEEHSHAGHGQPLRRRRVGPAVRGDARLHRHRPRAAHAHRAVTCPFTGEQLVAVPALAPDVAIVHAQQADREGNVQLWGITGVQKEAVLAAERSLVTVEEIVDELEPRAGRVVLPGWAIDARRRGARRSLPSYAHGITERDNDFYREWDAISRDRETFAAWMDEQRARRRGGRMSATAAEVLTVVAARGLAGKRSCFVGVGRPSTAANLARMVHAPELVLVYESGTIGAKPTRLPLSIGDGELAETADAVVSVPEMFNYWLQPGPHRGRLPRRRADRPLRQHQHDGDRRLRAPAHAPARRRRGAGDRDRLSGGRRDRAQHSHADVRRGARLPDDERGAHDVGHHRSRRARARAAGELTLTAVHPGVAVDDVRGRDRLGAARRGRGRRHRGADERRARGAAGARWPVADCFILDAVRTPFGRYGGALAGVRPDDLAAHVVRALVERAPDLDPAQIDDVLFGDANGAGEDNRDVARMAVLLAGLPTSVPGTTVNRLCGSWLDAAMQGSRAVETGDAALVLVGGVESMRRAPWVLLKPEKAFARASRRCTRRRSAGGWSTRRCPASGRSRSARAPRSWPASTGSRARRRTRSRCAATSAPPPRGTTASTTTGSIPVPGTELERDERSAPTRRSRSSPS